MFPLTLRETKGSPLTHQEMDSNFQSVFGIHNLLQIEEQTSRGTPAGTFTSGSWIVRNLNTIMINNIENTSLLNNRITLPKGTYYCKAQFPAYRVDTHATRLVKVSNVPLLYGTTPYTPSGAASTESLSIINGLFELLDNSEIELQHYCTTTQSTYGLGATAGSTIPGVYNIFSFIKIWKIGD